MERETKIGILKVVDIAFALGIGAAAFFGLNSEMKKNKDAKNKYNEYLNSDVVMAQIDDKLTQLNKLYDEDLISQNEYTKVVYEMKERAAEKIYRDNADFQEIKEKRDDISGLGWGYLLAGTIGTAAGLSYIITNVAFGMRTNTPSSYFARKLENRGEEVGDPIDEEESWS